MTRCSSSILVGLTKVRCEFSARDEDLIDTHAEAPLKNSQGTRVTDEDRDPG